MANEKRLIDYEMARNATYEEVFWTESEQAVVRHFLAKLPKADAVEVVHGRWQEHRPNVYECTACNTWYGNYGGCEEWAYCPHCGAKMDGGNEDG